MNKKTAEKLTLFLFGHFPIPAYATILKIFQHRLERENQHDIARAIEQYVDQEERPPSWAQFKPFIDFQKRVRLEREGAIDTDHRLPPPPNDPITPEAMKDFMRQVDGIVNRFGDPFTAEEPRKHIPKVPDERMAGPICWEDGCYAPATIEISVKEWNNAIVKVCDVHARVFADQHAGDTANPLTVHQVDIPRPESPPVEPEPPGPKSETFEDADAPTGLSGPPMGGE